MPIAKIEKLPDYCPQNLSKYWDNITCIFGDSGIVASKTNKKGDVIQLLITNGGKKRQIISCNKEIVDETDINGIRRTYIYKKQPDGTIVGTMKIDKKTPEGKRPLVIFAKWISESIKPIMAELTLNPKHPDSMMTIKEQDTITNVIKKYQERITQAILENFNDSIVQLPMPKKVTLKTADGTMKVVAESIDDSKSYIQQLNLIEGQPNIEQMRVVV